MQTSSAYCLLSSRGDQVARARVDRALEHARGGAGLDDDAVEQEYGLVRGRASDFDVVCCHDDGSCALHGHEFQIED